jgi:hypothetical protein
LEERLCGARAFSAVGAVEKRNNQRRHVVCRENVCHSLVQNAFRGMPSYLGENTKSLRQDKQTAFRV